MDNRRLGVSREPGTVSVLTLVVRIHRSPQEFVSSDMLKAQAEIGTMLAFCFFGETMRCPYIGLATFKGIVYNDNTLSYV